MEIRRLEHVCTGGGSVSGSFVTDIFTLLRRRDGAEWPGSSEFRSGVRREVHTHVACL
jgi:hypothetical protein